MSLFIRVLRERGVVSTRSEMGNPLVRPEDKVTSLARTVRLTPGAETFAERFRTALTVVSYATQRLGR